MYIPYSWIPDTKLLIPSVDGRNVAMNNLVCFPGVYVKVFLLGGKIAHVKLY